MKKVWIYNIIFFLIFSCSTKDFENKSKENDTVVSPNNSSSEKSVDPDINILNKKFNTIEKKKFDNGLIIEWYQKGDGAELKNGDVVQIDYKVELNNGKIVDGNQLLNRKSLPFIIGYGMQTKGWDIALKELKVGDFARILIPSPLARGEVGVKGLIPKNADNYLYIRILEKVNPIRTIDGCKVWLFEENKSNTIKFNRNNRIVMHAMVSTPSSPLFVNTYRQNKPFSFQFSDNGVVPGLKKSLINSKKADRMYILVPSKEAYGSEGYLDFVKPNEDVFYNIFVMDVQ